MRKSLFFGVVMLFLSARLQAQIGIGTPTPDASAIIDLTSTDRGFLLPRMTRAQMVSIPGPAAGLMVFCTDCNPRGLWVRDTSWTPVMPLFPVATFGASTLNCTGTLSGNYFVDQVMTSANTKTVTITVSTAGYLSASTNYANGVAFSVSKLQLTTGASQSIVLVASGTPSAIGNFMYTVDLGGQTCNFNVDYLSTSSGGTAVVSSYNCTGADAGTLVTGVAASGVTHTITANVTSVGTYNITTNTVNGITYSGSGTFAGTGAQPVVLTASGTPIAFGNNNYTLNGTPSCSFSVQTNYGSSNGSADVSAWNCTGADAGTLTMNVAASGVTHTITATVVTAGTYSVSVTLNGVTFSGSGTFPGTGSQPVILTAAGTPLQAGMQTYSLNTTPGCSFIRNVLPPALFKCDGGTVSYSPSGSIPLTGNTAYTGTFTLPYTAGNGTSYGVASRTVEGLTLTRVPGTYAAGGGVVTYNLTGTTPALLGLPYDVFTLPEGCMTTVLDRWGLYYSGAATLGLVNGSLSGARYRYPVTIVLDSVGNAYVGDYENHVIRKITAAGQVSTYAGTGTAGFADGASGVAQFNHPVGLWLDRPTGDLYVTDMDNNRIRKITAAGIVSTIAGSGTAGTANGTGTAAQFNQPYSMAMDASGNFYISDRSNHKIRKMTSAFVVTNFAGSGVAGFNNATGTTAQFNFPTGITIDASGNLYVADMVNNRIRKITPAAVVTTLAGQSANGAVDATGTSASFFNPHAVCMDVSGDIIVGDRANHKIRRVTPAGVVTTVAGIGANAYYVSNWANCAFANPQGVAVDNFGRIYVADVDNNRLRIIVPR